ncbi:hypothetical protein D3C73_559760 [compost metagenome]
MNTVMAMKNIPLMIRVMNRVVSMEPQLEAAGVACQGASMWNSTDAITISIRTIAIAISSSSYSCCSLVMQKHRH